MVSFLTGTMVCGFSLYHILAYFLIYSCMGWCLEVIYAAATTGQLVNRGFLFCWRFAGWCGILSSINQTLENDYAKDPYCHL